MPAMQAICFWRTRTPALPLRDTMAWTRMAPSGTRTVLLWQLLFPVVDTLLWDSSFDLGPSKRGEATLPASQYERRKHEQKAQWIHSGRIADCGGDYSCHRSDSNSQPHPLQDGCKRSFRSRLFAHHQYGGSDLQLHLPQH